MKCIIIQESLTFTSLGNENFPWQHDQTNVAKYILEADLREKFNSE